MLGYLRAQRVPDPDDVLGEVFLHVARDIKRFSGDDAAARRWVFSIAHNRAIDAHRRLGRDRTTPTADVPEMVAADEPPPSSIDPELEAALAALTADQREVLVLRFVADLSLEDVARITKRKVGGVKALQHRGLENLRRAISPRAS